LEKKDVLVASIRVIKDIYEGIRIRVRNFGRDTTDFPIDIGFHQGVINIELFSFYYAYG